VQEIRILRLAGLDFVNTEKAINGCLSEGFEIFSVLTVVDSVIYTLLKTTKIYGGSGAGTAFPTEKQLGYVGWSYQEAGVSTESLNISREQASALIQHHKDSSCTDPFEQKEALEHLKTVLGNDCLDNKKPVETDDDIPF